MVIFFRELARNRKSFLIWTACLVLSNVGMLALYPTIVDQAGEYNDLVKKLPVAVLEGMGMDNLDFSRILDYFAYVFIYIILFGGVYAMLLASSIISKEENEKTIEFLLAKPVTRNQIVTAKSLCVLFYIVSFNLIFIVADYITFECIKKIDYSLKTFILAHLGFLILQLTFAAIGMLISVFIVKAKSIYPITFGVVLGTFFINIISAISDKLENLKYLTPFKYVNPSDIVKSGRIENVYIIIMCAIIVVSVALTYVFYNRKNISV